MALVLPYGESYFISFEKIHFQFIKNLYLSVFICTLK